jgi:hypothetical protein
MHVARQARQASKPDCALCVKPAGYLTHWAEPMRGMQLYRAGGMQKHDPRSLATTDSLLPWQGKTVLYVLHATSRCHRQCGVHIHTCQWLGVLPEVTHGPLACSHQRCVASAGMALPSGTPSSHTGPSRSGSVSEAAGPRHRAMLAAEVHHAAVVSVHVCCLMWPCMPSLPSCCACSERNRQP